MLLRLRNSFRREGMYESDLANVARELVAGGKGILAADESFSTIKKRFQKLDIESTPQKRRDYREVLFTTPGIEKYISGVILFDETMRQTARDKTLFPKFLEEKGIIPGIKVDMGTRPLPHFPGEEITEGLDGLPERVEEYYRMGARFAKWRAVIHISEATPTDTAIQANAEVLARYAAICQEGGLVPIVEPEVLMAGEHSIDVCEAVTYGTLLAVFSALQRHLVVLEEMLLKPNMVTAGEDHPNHATVEEVASATVRVLQRTVPAAVPGIVFLSGGQSPELATQHLNEMNRMSDNPWMLSFSYGRALQEPAMEAWNGHNENAAKAQEIFFHRCQMNHAAVMGEYSSDMDREIA
jgi:fructose-bisphosphate aldolase, class I